MIIIKKKFGTNLETGDIFCEPERELKAEEKMTITSVSGDDVNYIYFQGDEPVNDNTNS